MAEQQGQPPLTPEEREALLKEYESADKEATNTATWVWSSTTVFLAAWIAGLGLAAVNLKNIPDPYVWALSGLGVAAQVVWLPFIARSFRIRGWLFFRQRQIERHLSIIKSMAIDTADHLDRLHEYAKTLSPRAKRDLEAFADHVRAERPVGWLDGVAWVIGKVFECLGMGRAGRASLYLLSFIVALAYICLAFAALLEKSTCT